MASNKIYTKNGDKGQTLLIGGDLVSKSLPRVNIYGELDELNSYVGLAMAHLQNNNTSFKDDIDFLTEIQRAIFDIGSLLACESSKWDKYNLKKIDSSLIGKLEDNMDEFNKILPELTGFILPRGNVCAATFHVCRSVCRRLERELVTFEENNKSEVPTGTIQFINRLSDYFFVLARYVNLKDGGHEVLK